MSFLFSSDSSPSNKPSSGKGAQVVRASPPQSPTPRNDETTASGSTATGYQLETPIATTDYQMSEIDLNSPVAGGDCSNNANGDLPARRERNIFDGIISCGAGFSTFEVSQLLLNDQKIRNRFAAKVIAILCLQLLISFIIVLIMQHVHVYIFGIGVFDVLQWLPLIPITLYAITFITFRVLQLTKNKVINLAFAVPLMVLFVVSLSLMYPVSFWEYYLASLFFTLAIMGILLYFQVYKTDLFEPSYKFYLIALVDAIVVSFVTLICVVVVTVVRYNGMAYFGTETILAIFGILLSTVLIALIVVYELRKLISGRRMNLNENNYVVSAALI